MPVGHREIAKRSEHGLGRYLDPISPNQDRRDRHGHRIWISEAWHWVLRHHEDDTTPMPEWASRPALSRVTVSSPLLARPFTAPDRGRPWRERIKPFNFLLVATIDPFGYPPGADPTRFRLIAPYTNDPDQWLSLGWRNVYDPDGPRYRITTDRDEPSDPCVLLVKTYADVLLDYRNHSVSRARTQISQSRRKSEQPGDSRSLDAQTRTPSWSHSPHRQRG